MPPDTKKGGAGTVNPEHRPNTQQGANDTLKVQTELPLRYPLAWVSLYAPHASRRTWWYCYVCDHCKHGHQGQLRHATDEESAEQAVRGVRRSRCGRLLWFVVARTYRGQSSEVAA